MRNCPNCRIPFNENEMNDKRRYSDEVMQELYRLKKTSELCLDCIMEKWAAEIGKARLDNKNLAYS